VANALLVKEIKDFADPVDRRSRGWRKDIERRKRERMQGSLEEFVLLALGMATINPWSPTWSLTMIQSRLIRKHPPQSTPTEPSNFLRDREDALRFFDRV
jgi:hypothetical protein